MKEETRKVVVLDMEDKIKLQKFIIDLEQIYNNYESSSNERPCIGNLLYYLQTIEEKINQRMKKLFLAILVSAIAIKIDV